ncbi:MAG: arginine repressor [Actinobacteria bacterium]|nr:arginine repressor [Actinomycetota bacterium]
MSQVTSLTKTARHARIAAILAREQVHSQEELAELLERYASVHVTQATLSRDLDELGVVRLRGADGALVYALPEQPGGPGSLPGGALGEPQARDGSHLPRGSLGGAPAEPLASAAPAEPLASGGPRTGDAPGRGQAVRQVGAGGLVQARSGQSAQAGGHAPAGESARTARLTRYLGELMTSAEASANLVVLRTPAGAAQFLASVIDHTALPQILGTVAGDDTVLIITRDPAGGDALATDFLRRARHRR